MTIERGHLLAISMDSTMHGGALHGGHQLRSRQSRHNARRALHVWGVAFGCAVVLWQAIAP